MASTHAADATVGPTVNTPTRTDFGIANVASADGTVISYRQLGHGPGIVLLHGAMELAASHLGLARALADTFTVYLPERRGHNVTRPIRSTYGIDEEVRDLAALLAKTGANDVFGVSSGGLIALEAARRLDGIRRVAVYEPALLVDGSLAADASARYDREIAEGRTAAALISGMQAARLGPPIFNLIPRFLLERITGSAMRSEDKTARPGDVTMRMLAPTLHYDFVLVREMAGAQERFRTLGTDTLLLGGSRSPAWLRTALTTLEGILPKARRIEFNGLDHGGSSDRSATNRSGNPALVADELRRFFA